MQEEMPFVIFADPLRDFCVRALRARDVSEVDAQLTADVLVTADLRGVDSHGVARLRRYVRGLADGTMLARAGEEVLMDCPATALIDAGGGLGQPVSYRAMEMAIDKARNVGAGFVAVR
ncbi:MAG: Ldh family oxidoreductase, partial [Chloroflexi bacterium]|nr:Ldh family oxidoreductase [Chloroflexota bacterium]